MKFYLEYFGCRSNQAEMQELALDLERRGYELTSNPGQADFAILNTCCVTARAEKDVHSYLKRNYRSSRLVWFVTGCLVNKDPEIRKLFPDCYFLDNDEKAGLAEIIMERFPLESNIIYHSGYKSRFFLKIQNGCNFRCSFCIVPYLRGKSESLPLEEIGKKARRVAALGYQEIVLTGINLSSYGYDLFPRKSLLDVAETLAAIRNVKLVRLSSLDPRFINFTFIKRLAEIDKIADHFHLSLQSGSESVLKRMQRSQRVSEMEQIIISFRQFFPDANIGADIISGFPTESEEEFEQTRELVQKGLLNYLHLFPYSPRPLTKAFGMTPVRPEIVKRRMATLMEINRELKLQFRRRFLERELRAILIDDKGENANAVTSNYINVLLPKTRGLKKKLFRLRIKRVLNENICEGEVAR